MVNIDAPGIDNVTISNLGMATRAIGINLNDIELDIIIDIVEELEKYGDNLSLHQLQTIVKNHKR